jgi:hypothetical protein
MKKILFLGFILTLIFSISASAQIADGNKYRHDRETRSYNDGDRNRSEVKRFHQDNFRYKMARRKAYRDGRLSRHERRHLEKMRRHERCDLHRYRHNEHHHVI